MTSPVSPAPRWRVALASPLLWALVLLGIFLIVAEQVSPLFFLHDDNASQFIGLFAHDFRVLTETGQLAEVNFYQYGGEPFLEQGQTGVLYPPIYLCAALAQWLSGDLRWTIEWLAVFHLGFGLVGFYKWMRQTGAERWIAALGGLTWVLNPFVIIIASSWINVVFVACYLPWIFWAFDRVLLRADWWSSLKLGISLGLFCLQGTVQWVIYAIFFLGGYAFVRLLVSRSAPLLQVLFRLGIAVLVFFAITLPLLLPMIHAASGSEARSLPMPIHKALALHVTVMDAFQAQFYQFRPHFVFGVTSVILFAPVWFFYPLMLIWFPMAAERFRSRLFPLLVLAPTALFFSGIGHVYLSILPVFNKFRWPYKIYLFVDFFLIAAFVLALASWFDVYGKSVRGRIGAFLCLSLVLGLSVFTSATHHAGNYFSNTALPTSQNPLPEIDPSLGRVVSLGEIPYDTTGYRYLTYAYGTFFRIPSLGGYNPLAGQAQINFANGLAFTNLLSGPMTPALRTRLEKHAVRYWVLDPHSPYVLSLKFNDLKILSRDPERMVLEDTDARPLAMADDDPKRPCPVTYAGNSLVITLPQPVQSVNLSLGPTDGWWGRFDRGPWKRQAYADTGIRMEIPSGTSQLEVRYFDARFRKGLYDSFVILIGLLALFAGERWLRGRPTSSRDP